MTVENQTKKVTAAGNDVATTFSFSPMVIFSSDQLEVTYVDSLGNETLLTEGTGASNYSVSVTSYPGTGSIVYPADTVTPLATGDSLVIRRVLTLEQLLDLNNQGGYFPDLQEYALDKLLMIDLQQQEELDRSFRFPVSATGISTTTALPSALKYLRINAAEDGMEWTELSSGLGAAYDLTPESVSLSAGSQGVSSDYARGDHVHLLPTVTIAKGGTGATTAAGARTNLGLGDAALRTVGVAEGNVPVMDATGYPAADGSQITNLTIAPAIQPWGLRLSNNLVDAANDIDIAEGEVIDTTRTTLIKLTSSITKQIDAAWAVGTNAGGLDTGTVAADNFYHVWLIKRSDTGVVDALFSLNGRYPTMPASYDIKQRIGMVYVTTGPAINPFLQNNNRFTWLDRIVEYSGVLSTGSGTKVFLPVTAPYGYKWPVYLAAHTEGTNESVELCHGDTPDPGGAGLPNVPKSDLVTVTTNSTNASVNAERITNYLGEVAAITQDTPTFHLSMLGWEDPLQPLDRAVDEAWAGTAVEDASAGVTPWVNPSNATGASDSTDATATAGGAEESRYLKATNFGFAIPSGVTITGIQVVVRHVELTPAVTKGQARIVKGGTIGTTDGKVAPNGVGSPYEEYVMGGPDDLWGETWTSADINSANFGFATTYNFAASLDKIGVDSIKIRVFYK